MTDYMGSVDRARAWMYRGDNSLIRHLQGNSASWPGFHAGLHPFFSSDIARSLGLALVRMKPFCAGGFLSALGSFKRFPSGAGRLGLSRRNFTRNRHRQPLRNLLGIVLVAVETYDQIFKPPIMEA
ncbi:MAG: hypothetical protein EOS50_27800 [Mesorhizobium sp.]|uniref:hypothetical protein n=1 Tax=Mesorhizobium sp. TaxID=1871066 RepID=UPI000FE81830|nr:hypothetical protein [Mesorhizobium sp.]RWE64461.1 MAG: hypothetical protein EOS62_29280 [Mesorhizobium sp.]RWF51591.1 MAG: hypothetical protein EOS50_27800 [Mesorhizobium sp.]